MICSWCSIEFFGKNANNKHCSDDCRKKTVDKNKKRHLRVCEGCKIEFNGLKNQKYCGPVCFNNFKVSALNKMQQAQRKYPKIEGLNRCQIFRKFNPDKGREELSRDNMKRVVIIQFLGGACCKCGYSNDIRALQLDHLNNDGYEDRRKEGRSGKVYRYYVNKLDEAKDNLQVLCANCHAIKTSITRDILKRKAKEYKETKNATKTG